MRPLEDFTREALKRIEGVFLDIDDTLTTDGRLTGDAYIALERLQKAGLMVVPVTGRPAGWCDHMARMWPIAAIIGENGAFYFRYDHDNKRMIRHYHVSPEKLEGRRQRLTQIRDEVLAAVPGTAVSADQPYRETDLAIDFCEDVPPLPASEVRRIKTLFENFGATAKISSIHVNGWIGKYDKLSMSKTLMREEFAVNLDAVRERYIFIGDSPNDAPMFAYFPNSVGVANIAECLDECDKEPVWVTKNSSGSGFVELTNALVLARAKRRTGKLTLK